MTVSNIEACPPIDGTSQQEFPTHGCPNGWMMFIHPQGWVYFRNPIHHVITDEDIRDETILEKLNAACEWLGLPSEMEQDIHVAASTKPPVVIFVNHDHAFASFKRDLINQGIEDIGIHRLVRLRRLYYSYLQHHCVHMPTPQNAVHEATDALVSYRLDYIVNGAICVAPFSKSECENLLNVLESLKQNGMTYHHSGGTTTFIAWILKSIYRFRLLDQYGKHTRKQFTEFRSSLKPPFHSHPQIPSFIQAMLTVIMKFPFFGVPETYLAHAKDASDFRGRLFELEERWEAYTRQLTREYSDFILVSTVLLSATMGFLAVPDIEQVAKALGLISVFSALSSIVVGVYFVWRHHRPPPSKSTMAYIHKARNNPLGLTGHAILLSLPATFLVWSIASFAAAVIAYTVQHAGTRSISIWTVVGVFVVFCFLLSVGLITFSKIWVWKR